VSVVGADVEALMAAQFLETHPDVCLDVFHEMAKMNMAICVGQGGSDENLTGHCLSDPIDKKRMFSALSGVGKGGTV
jgi:hypothetical protein